MDIKDIMNMSDEELSNVADFGDRPVEKSEDKSLETTDDADKGEDTVVEGDDTNAEQENQEVAEGEATDDPSLSGSAEDGKGDDDNKAQDGDEAKAEGKSDSTVAAPAEVDYKAQYDKIMAPFKANGHEIKLESPEEVIKLMQLGANYTKKMQAIQPNLKTIRMLENNNLLDEGKLSHLIDLSKGDKGAIAKFLKDHSIDPMDIDTETAVDYKQGNHSVSDLEMSFQSTLDDTMSTESGQKLISQINSEWDQASKQAIFQKPELIRVIAQQAEDGIYPQIAAEVYRRKVLGDPQIASLPFLQAYQQLGQEMAQSGRLTFPEANKPKIIATAPAAKKQTAANGDKAKAAAPSAKQSGKATTVINPMDGSDDEFLKAFVGKV